MKKVLHIGWCCLEVIIIAYVIILTSFILHRNLYGFTQFGNYTFVNVSLWDIRNINGVKKNDLLVIKTNKDIHENDMIYYYYVENDRYIVKTNKVIDISEGTVSTSYQIDDNEMSLIPSSRIIGTSGVTYGFLGGILSILESRYGFIFLVLIPIVIVFSYQLYDFIVTIRSEREKADELEKTIIQKKEYYEVPVIDRIIEVSNDSFLNKNNKDIEIL